MVNRKKGSTTSLHPRTDSVSPNRPRFNRQERLLSRFYEPLVLLYTLGRTRGERTSFMTPPRDDLAHLPLKDLRRVFLNELAYMCDYDKGGATVTALGLQFTPQRHIFWVASNSSSKTIIIDFLRSLLTQIIHLSTASNTGDFAAELASQCIAFSGPRIKKYKSHLKPQLQRCISYLTKTEQVVEPGLVKWLQSWEDTRSHLDLCRYAYESRKSDFMHILARLSAEPTYKSNEDAIHSVFRMVRHNIGRLGHHFKAADTLVSCAPRFMDLLHDFEVRDVLVLTKSVIPPPDQLTELGNILVRMLPRNSPELEHYQQALREMDTRYQISDEFLDNYTRPVRNACIHAELQILEQFYAQKMHFAGDDPYIACSKPACFCCLLYFRNHPGHVVEPVSHNKIYLNWRPPDFSTPIGIIGPNHQRDILNAMSKEIRKEALHQIDGKTAPKAWHPDSVTGITPSTQGEQIGRPTEGVGVALGIVDNTLVPDELFEISPDSGAMRATLFPAVIEEEGVTCFVKSTSVCDGTNETPKLLEPSLEEPFSDSDESGGVEL